MHPKCIGLRLEVCDRLATSGCPPYIPDEDYPPAKYAGNFLQ